MKSTIKIDKLPNFDALLKKLNEFIEISPSDTTILSNLVILLLNTSFYHSATPSESSYETIYRLISLLPSQNIFPLLDLLRIVILIPSCRIFYNGIQGQEIIKLILLKARDARGLNSISFLVAFLHDLILLFVSIYLDKNAVIMLIFRVLTNFLVTPTLSFSNEIVKEILQFIDSLKGFTFNASVHTSIFTFLSNLTHLILKDEISSDLNDIQWILVYSCQGLGKQSDNNILGLACIIIGSFLVTEKYKGQGALIAKENSILTTAISLSSIDKLVQSEFITILSL